MKILVFSDLHSDHDAARRLMDIEADYYFAAGDLVNWARGLNPMGEILQYRASRMYVLPGNHESEADIERLCADYGLNPFHGRSIEIEGIHVAGLGYSNRTPFNTPGEYSETEIANRLERFNSLDPMILICHCPPRGTALDESRPGVYYGSDAVGDFIARKQPMWFFCGHIHEAAGRTTMLGSTHAVNAGKKGYLLDFATLE